MFPRAIVSAGSVISGIGCVWWLTQPCSHFNSTLPSTKNKLYLPLTFLWLWDPTGGPSCEEVKVRDGVHLHVVKEHFVIRTSVNLKETRTSRFLAKKHIRTRATFRKKTILNVCLSVYLRDQDADLAASGVTSDRPQGSQIGNLVAQVFRTAVSFGISWNTTSLDRDWTAKSQTIHAT